MSEIPDKWELASISEVLLADEKGNRIQQGWSPRCETYPAPEGKWGALKTTAIQLGKFLPDENKCLPEQLTPRPHLQVECNDIVLTCAGPRNRCGIACRVPTVRDKLMISGKMYRLRVNKELVRPAYLEKYLVSSEAQAKIDRMKSGINDSGLNLTKDRFFTLQVPLPPVEEQRRIVAKIEELFSELGKGVESLKTARAQLKTYRQSLLKAAFEGRLTEQWRRDNADKLITADQLLQKVSDEREAKYQENLHEYEVATAKWKKEGGVGRKPRKPKPGKASERISRKADVHLKSVPDGWLIVDGETFCDPARSISYGVIKLGSQDSNGVPVLRSSNVRNLKLDFSGLRKVRHEIASPYSRTLLTGGEILITIRGTLGGVVKVPDSCDGYNISREVAMFSPVDHDLAHCTHYFLASPQTQSWFTTRLKGIAYTGLNIETLKRAPIPVPPPEEQKKIANVLDECISQADALDNLIEEAIYRSRALKQSVLKYAFEGKLVPQNPDDEAVSALMERIRQVRADAPKSKRRKRKTGATA